MHTSPSMQTEQTLVQLLTSNAQAMYALYDAAQDSELLPLLRKHNIAHFCLYDGVKAQTLSNVAPYLIPCKHFQQNPIDFVDSIWQRGVAMLLETSVSLKELKSQLKKMTFIKNSEGKDCYFRYYDTRAFSKFLKIASNEQLTFFFGDALKKVYWLDLEEDTFLCLHKQSAFDQSYINSFAIEKIK
jgi:hypothetical protein